MENLKFRRQYFFSSKKNEKFQNWKTISILNNYLYIHPDCEDHKLSYNGMEITVIGYFLDPRDPEKSTEDVLNGFANVLSVHDIPELLYPLVGRFVLIYSKNENHYIFNDACGLKTVFYSFDDGGFQIGSQPNLFKLKTKIDQGTRFQTYRKSKHVRANREHWIPSGISLCENVNQLIPNHYLNCTTGTQYRYFPVKKLKEESLAASAKNMAEILQNTMLAADKKFELALPMTAGFDSRTLFSASKNIADNILFYTLKYRTINNKSRDIYIPSKLLKKLGYKHKVWDCRGPLNKEFIEIYESNSDMSHVNDWGHIANGIYRLFPGNKIAVKGNCSEVGRCFYYPDGVNPGKVDVSTLVSFERGWDELDFVKTAISEWHTESEETIINLEYNFLDFFYWEHRMGSWQAQSQLEWDIAQEAFTPFNNRELLDVILSVPSEHRCGPDYPLFKECINLLWPEVLSVPFNPVSLKQKRRGMVRRFLVKVNLLNLIKDVLRR